MANDAGNVPLVDLGWQHEQIKDEVAAGWDSVIQDTSFILGPQVAQFEKDFADFSGVSHCIGSSLASSQAQVGQALRRSVQMAEMTGELEDGMRSLMQGGGGGFG